MSDSEDSIVTYMAVSSPFGGLSDIGSSGVDGPPVMLEDPYAYVVAAFQAPPSPDYVPGLEEPEQAPISLEFIPEPVYPEFMPPKDEEDEEDPIDYPADRGDDDDDDDESSDNDEDDDDDVEEDEDDEEEEEHPGLTFAIPSPPSSPLSPWSSPLPQIPSPPLLVSSLVPVSPPPLPVKSYYRTPPSGTPTTPTRPLPTPSPPLLLPSTDRRADMPEVYLPPRKRLCIALGLRYEVDESSSAPTARPVYWGGGGGRGQAPASEDLRVGQWMTNFVIRLDKITDNIMGDWMMHRMTGESNEDTIIGTTYEDYSLADSDLRSTGTACGDTKTDEYTADTGALTWWNSHVRTVGHDVAMFPEESDKIERYVSGLPDMIHGSVVASRPKTMQEAIEIETELMDKKIRTFAER
ncbi:hypothetical protein Tco_0228730 [Tanacetum coccineum]